MFSINSRFRGFNSFLQSPGIQGLRALAGEVADLTLKGITPILAGRAFSSAREGSFLSCVGYGICTLAFPSMKKIIKYGLEMWGAGREISHIGLQTYNLIRPVDEPVEIADEHLAIVVPQEDYSQIVRDLSLGVLSSAQDIVEYSSGLVSITALGVDNALGGNIAGEAVESFHVIRREGRETLLVMNQKVERVFNAGMGIVRERLSARSLSEGAVALKAFNLEVPNTLNKLSSIKDRVYSVKIMVVAFIMFVVIARMLSSPGAWLLVGGKKVLLDAKVEEERRAVEEG